MFAGLQWLLVVVISYVIFGAGVWALVDAARRDASAFVNAGKQTKTLWLILVGAATVWLFIALPAPLGRGGGPFDIFGLAAAVVVIVYHVGVKPSLGPHRRGPSGGGRSNRNKGGW